MGNQYQARYQRLRKFDGIDGIFKLIIENHEEHCKILKPEEQSNEEDHYEDNDQRVFIFKHKI